MSSNMNLFHSNNALDHIEIIGSWEEPRKLDESLVLKGRQVNVSNVQVEGDFVLIFEGAEVPDDISGREELCRQIMNGEITSLRFGGCAIISNLIKGNFLTNRDLYREVFRLK